MQLWSADVGRFWIRALCSLILLLVVGWNCHTIIRPARLYPQDLFTLLPLLVCIVVSIGQGRRVDLLTRFTFGLYQALIVLWIYSNQWFRRYYYHEPVEVLAEWAVIAGVYTLVFGMGTHVIALRLAKPPPLVLRCEKCAYSLKGLMQPRCPECGTIFDPAILEQNAPAFGDEPEKAPDPSRPHL